MVVESFSVLNLLFLAALALLVVVSGGILYLSAEEWRNRRLQAQDKRQK